MEKRIDYLPYIEVNEVIYNLLGIGVCIDFGGRQFDCEFQEAEPNEEGKRPVHRATYYPLSRKWENDWPTDNLLTSYLHGFMAAFDTTGHAALAHQDKQKESE